MKLIYLKSTLKCNSFDVAIGIKIPFFRVLITIEPDRFLLQFVTTNCLIGNSMTNKRIRVSIKRKTIKQFVVTNCRKERPGSIVTETLRNGIFITIATSKESHFNADFKYISQKLQA